MATPSPTGTQILLSDSPGGVGRPYSSAANVLLSSRGAPWEDAISVEVDRVLPDEIPRSYTSRCTIVIYLGRQLPTIERLIDGRYETLRLSPGDILIDPPGAMTGVRWNMAHDVLILSPNEAHLSRSLGEGRSARLELVRRSCVRDAQIFHIGHAYLAELKTEFGSGPLYGDFLASALLARLLNNHSDAPDHPELRAQGLPKQRLRKVIDYIDDNLESNLRLAELAGIAMMSSYYFCRQFKASTGMSPHQYVISRRIARARRLLSETGLSIAEISAALGFADQAHFCTVFRRSTGTTPARFRSSGGVAGAC